MLILSVLAGLISVHHRGTHNMAATSSSSNDMRKQFNSDLLKWIGKLSLSFVLFILGMTFGYRIINRFGLPFELLAVVFALFGFVYIYQIFSIKKIRCPNCHDKLFNSSWTLSFNVLFQKHCPHCNFKFR
jgi:hypothetical protein